MTIDVARSVLLEKRADLQKWIDCVLNPEETYPEICAYAKALDVVLSAQQEPEKNEPLMREELQKMDGQPVWIEFIPDPDGQVKIWALVSVDPEDGEIFLLNSLGGASAYEEVWADIRAIYRHPPKEEC